jgi:hypothetical protein
VVLPMAANLCDDLHVCNGGSAHKDHLKEDTDGWSRHSNVLGTFDCVSWTLT